jgi:hypothetical protein
MYAVIWGVLVALFWRFLPVILMAVGSYAISDTASDKIFSYLRTQIDTQVNSVPGQFLNALQLSGLVQAVGIIVSAAVFAASIKAVKGSVKMASSGGGSGSGGTGAS